MEIDFSKPFMIFSGDNGTGKTYAASLLFSMLDNVFLKLLTCKELDEVFQPTKMLKSGEDGKINCDKLYDLVKRNLSSEKEIIARLLDLNIPTDKFGIEVLTTNEQFAEDVKQMEVNVGGLIKKRAGSLVYNLRRSLGTSEVDILWKADFGCGLFFDGRWKSHMLTAERGGIYTFSKEIAVGRLRNPDSARSYPYPIGMSLAHAEDLKRLKENQGCLADLCPEIEDEVLHGKLKVGDEGEVLLSVSDNQDLSINQVASAVKTLSPLVFYLRHLSGYCSFLIIDEPELNLHPKNQVLLAKLFVKMVNAGAKLLISTHSDYIIREINNAVMAHSLTNLGDEAAQAKGYDKSLCLDPEQLAPYIFEESKGKVKVRPLEVDNFGFSMPSIDETIDKQNEVTNEFYELLKYAH